MGIDPARLDRITDRSMPENFNALTEGRIEWARFFEPVVEQALASGKGHLWHAASARGRTSYIAFVTTRERLVRDAEPLLSWSEQSSGLSNGSMPGLRRRCRGHFLVLPSVRHPRAGRRPRPHQSQSVRGRDPVLPENGFDCLRRSLVSGGFILRPMPYTACVDNRSALRVLPE